jgi:hypothetical protein
VNANAIGHASNSRSGAVKARVGNCYSIRINILFALDDDAHLMFASLKFKLHDNITNIAGVSGPIRNLKIGVHETPSQSVLSHSSIALLLRPCAGSEGN